MSYADKVAFIEVHENGHVFWPMSALGLPSMGHMMACKACGIVRRRDGKNSPCKGRVKVELRGEKP